MTTEKYIVKVNGEEWFLCDSFSNAIRKCEQVQEISKTEIDIAIIEQIIIENEFEYIDIS